MSTSPRASRAGSLLAGIAIVTLAVLNGVACRQTPPAVEEISSREAVEAQIASGELAAPTPVAFRCQGRDEELTASFYNQTRPASAVFTMGDRRVVALSVRTASGARYQGPDFDFWEHQGEAAVTWSGVNVTCVSLR